jgi:predicted RNase H-like nuclease (RuvC/YqgF family)
MIQVQNRAAQHYEDSLANAQIAIRELQAENRILQAENRRLQAENRILQNDNEILRVLASHSDQQNQQYLQQMRDGQRHLATARARARRAEQDLDTFMRHSEFGSNKRQRRDQNDQ